MDCELSASSLSDALDPTAFTSYNNPVSPTSSIDPSQLLRTDGESRTSTPSDLGVYSHHSSPTLSCSDDADALLYPSPPSRSSHQSSLQHHHQQEEPPPAPTSYQPTYPDPTTIYHSPIQHLRQTLTPTNTPSPSHPPQQRHPYLPPHHHQLHHHQRRPHSSSSSSSPLTRRPGSSHSHNHNPALNPRHPYLPSHGPGIPTTTTGSLKRRPLPPTSAPLQLQQLTTTTTTATSLTHHSPCKPIPTHPTTEQIPPPQETPQFQAHEPPTTLVLGLLLHLDRLTQECTAMRAFLRAGYADPDDDASHWHRPYHYQGDGEGGGDGKGVDVEGIRLRLRNENRGVTELDEGLRILPVRGGRMPSSSGEEGSEEKDHRTPTMPMLQTGREIMRLDHAAIDQLLDQYDIPFVPTMFLHEKKLAYLRFIGAGRALMHRVLGG